MIEINNLTTNPVDEEFLKNVGQKVLEGEHPSIGRVPKNLDLSIILIGPAKMRKLNKTYLRKNRVTDILAFSENSPPQNLGEIVICLREVKKNAKRYNLTFKKELARVLIHGILHLLGEDHEISKKRAKEMEIKQEYYLSQIFKS